MGRLGMLRDRGGRKDDLLDHAAGEIFLLGVADMLWNGNTAMSRGRSDGDEGLGDCHFPARWPTRISMDPNNIRTMQHLPETWLRNTNNSFQSDSNPRSIRAYKLGLAAVDEGFRAFDWRDAKHLSGPERVLEECHRRQHRT